MPPSQVLLGAIGAAAVLWSAAVLTIALAQRRLVFRPPRRIRPLQPGPHFGSYRVEPLRVEIAPGAILEGWRSLPLRGPTRGTLIYFGGRGENTTWATDMSSYLDGWSIVTFNYRGFGGSTGLATERAVMADAMRLYRLFIREATGPRVVAGRSLGSVVALRVARRVHPAAVVAMTPPSSVRDLVARIRTLRPAHRLLCHPLDALAHAGHVDCRALVLLARDDKRIPNEHSLRLAARLRGPTRIVTLEGQTHPSLPRSMAAQQAMAEFLSTLPSAPAPRNGGAEVRASDRLRWSPARVNGDA